MPGLNTSSFTQNVSVATNFATSFGSAVKDVGSTLGGLLSNSPNSTSVTGSIGAFASALGSAGLSIGASAKEALNALSALGNTTKFSDTFKPPSKTGALTPEDAYNKDTYSGTFNFPSDIGKYYMIFTFKKYDRKYPVNQPVELPLITINLPIPTNLQESFNASYSEKAMGITGLIADTVGKAVQSGTKEGFENAGGELRQVAEKEGLYYAGRSALGGLSDGLGVAADITTGTVLNPFQAMVFQGVSFRSHSFTYRFSPNSKKESEQLKRIVNEFKKRMLPSLDRLIMQFPDVVDISFGQPDGGPYFFKTCFLESMTINYAPQGTPAFFTTTNTPVEIEMTLNFKETSLVTREDIQGPSLSS